ncbi:MAG: monovalent cation/H+ antiporter complex subunit F [Actinomycetota bacterium]|nr:monovalent cation/H+ antiporter complex subunit F [Actinomycetota bacterium]MDP2287867.1 monovalent cation/H+ antiporter complex subunit F [Actinomycetota bacterium]
MTVADVALALVALGMLAAVYRAVRGPSAADRLVAAELGFIAAVCAIVLVEMRIDLPALLDIALAAVLIGFLATLGLARMVPARQHAWGLDAGEAPHDPREDA